jgi:hypothetical protein
LRPAQTSSLGDPISKKITRAKWAGGMVQAVEHLLCNCEALSSNPSTTKKKKKCQAWWQALIIPVLRRLRQGDPKFKASLGYIVRSYLKMY